MTWGSRQAVLLPQTQTRTQVAWECRRFVLLGGSGSRQSPLQNGTLKIVKHSSFTQTDKQTHINPLQTQQAGRIVPPDKGRLAA